MSLIGAAVCLVAIVAAWDMVRMVTRAARERAANTRMDALEAQLKGLRAADRLGELETQMKTHAASLRNLQKVPAPARRWGA